MFLFQILNPLIVFKGTLGLKRFKEKNILKGFLIFPNDCSLEFLMFYLFIQKIYSDIYNVTFIDIRNSNLI